MKREQYEKICEPVINKFKNLLQNFYEELQQKGICFDVIELIGGGTRIPAVIRAISEVFATEPSRTINSSECVAKGAALISAMNSSIFKVQPYSYFTISPYSIQLMING
jgi:heat shock protein 4